MFDGFILKVPLLNVAIRDMDLGRYSYCFMTCYNAGISMEKCASVAIKGSKVQGSEVGV